MTHNGLLVVIVAWVYLVWKYRRNKIIALGAITLGVAGIAFGLSKVPRLPDYVSGVFVALFLILSVFTLLLPAFYGVKWLVVRARHRTDTKWS
jgi:hypothetical protein